MNGVNSHAFAHIPMHFRSDMHRNQPFLYVFVSGPENRDFRRMKESVAMADLRGLHELDPARFESRSILRN